MAKRLVNWDLLRTLAMLFVVVVHSSQYLGPIYGIATQPFISEFAFICDPVFFVLSGYFAFRPLKTTYAKYLLNKLITIVLPIWVYSVVLYTYECVTGSVALGFSQYFNWFYGMLFGGWWFVPVLIPFLVLAPFLYTMFEALDDCLCKLLLKVVALFTLWGVAYTVLQWVSALAGIETLDTLSGVLSGCIPTEPVPGGYFMYFCLGYFIHRMPSLYPSEFLKRLTALGIAGWLLGSVAAVVGYHRSDPSFLWLFATIGIFLLFGKIQITGLRVSKIINWTAKRSYAIYLLQYTTIAIVYGMFNQFGLLDGTADMTFLLRLPLQVVAVFLSWILALMIASVVDRFVVEPIQNECKAKLRRQQ